MNLTVVSWNGDTRINDGTNYTCAILPGALIDLTSQAVYVDRAENFPYLSGAVLPAHSFSFRIIPAPNVAANWISTQRELIKSIFSIVDFTPHALVAKDENNKQWQIIGFPTRLIDDKQQKADTVFVVTLAVAEPVWQSVTVNSDTWNITGTGQQRTITPAGNIFTRPKFTITPTTNRATQWQYFRWVPIYNRVAVGLNNYPLEVTAGGLNTATLVNGSGVSNQINQIGGIGAADTTIPINTPVGGGLPNVGMGYVDTEQISWTSNGGGTSLTGVTRGIGGTTAATHANLAVITMSKIQVNASDLVVQVDGVQVDRWVDAPNTASTKVWITQTYQSSKIATLRTALVNSGAAVTVAFNRTAANLQVLTALKAARNQVFLIDNEAFTYLPGNVDLVKFQITSCNRGQKYTSTATHAINASIIWIEHDIWLLYGNAFVGAPDVNDSLKPIFDLHNSTNGSWVYVNFYDANNPSRPGSWYGSVISTRGKTSSIYTGNQKATANPSTELGMTLLNYQIANAWKSETAVLQWVLHHPTGITTVSMAGSKFVLATGTWPAVAGLQCSINFVTWKSVWNEAVPTLASTWQTFTHNAVALGATYTLLRLILSGTIAALANNEADIQGDTVTLTLDGALNPVVALNAEQTATYYLSATITNTNTGDYFTLAITVPLNQAITVDCVFKTVTLQDGANVIGALTPSTVRNDWLTLLPNVGNILQFDDTGTLGVTCQTQWQDRTL